MEVPIAGCIYYLYQHNRRVSRDLTPLVGVALCIYVRKLCAGAVLLCRLAVFVKFKGVPLEGHVVLWRD